MHLCIALNMTPCYRLLLAGGRAQCLGLEAGGDAAVPDLLVSTQKFRAPFLSLEFRVVFCFGVLSPKP